MDSNVRPDTMKRINTVELANAFGIKQAPTLVVIKGGEVEKYAGAGAIKAFLGN